MPFLDPGPAVAAGGDQVSDSTDGAPAKELVEKPRQASMLACTTSGEARAPAKAGVDARARHVRRAGGEGGESTRAARGARAFWDIKRRFTCRKSASHASRV